MFSSMFFNMILPLAFSALRGYINSPSSSQDGKVLDAVKDSVKYLSCKDNNSMTGLVSNAVNNVSMKVD